MGKTSEENSKLKKRKVNKYPKEYQQRMLALYERGLSEKTIETCLQFCRSIGVPYRTFRDWIAPNKELKKIERKNAGIILREKYSVKYRQEMLALYEKRLREKTIESGVQFCKSIDVPYHTFRKWVGKSEVIKNLEEERRVTNKKLKKLERKSVGIQIHKNYSAKGRQEMLALYEKNLREKTIETCAQFCKQDGISTATFQGELEQERKSWEKVEHTDLLVKLIGEETNNAMDSLSVSELDDLLGVLGEDDFDKTKEKTIPLNVNGEKNQTQTLKRQMSEEADNVTSAKKLAGKNKVYLENNDYHLSTFEKINKESSTIDFDLLKEIVGSIEGLENYSARSVVEFDQLLTKFENDMPNKGKKEADRLNVNGENNQANIPNNSLLNDSFVYLSPNETITSSTPEKIKSKLEKVLIQNNLLNRGKPTTSNRSSRTINERIG